VVHEVLAKARHGTRVVYVPGNHDEVLREFCGLLVGSLEVQREVLHTTADGRRLLVLHGDQFDGIVNYARWLAKLGDWAYCMVIELNRVFNAVRHRLGFGYWSLSAYLKAMVKDAVAYVDNFESAIAAEARRHGADGVVCGHIHKAEMRMIEGILYCNDGDWVESCTALVEQQDGTLEVLRWTEERRVSLAPALAA
jgi:UDP-2,3-diacylglucosamine pyrophosphatase LpxH